MSKLWFDALEGAWADGPFMPVRGAGCALSWPTLYTSPLGRLLRHGRDPLLLLAAA